ncbi:MAG TPA: ABC transporter ATP-binding protein [Tepidiformaceae bacterium]|nr:ABC transporter ATP-binding protein [Tepidiformaceae bacterium]
MTPILKATDFEALYGQRQVVFGINFEVPEGAIATVLGANGAGKSTTLRGIMSEIRTRGDLEFAGRRITGKRTEDVVRLGIAHVPEGRGTFTDLSVEENLRLGAYVRRDKSAIKADMARMYEYFPVLGRRQSQRAGTLSGGEQQMLAISRALMSRPKLLLLDEPSTGLAPLIIQEIFSILERINREDKVSMLLVEQDASLALKVASYAYVLETGRIAVSGPAEELRKSDSIRRSYLGY